MARVAHCVRMSRTTMISSSAPPHNGPIANGRSVNLPEAPSGTPSGVKQYRGPSRPGRSCPTQSGLALADLADFECHSMGRYFRYQNSDMPDSGVFNVDLTGLRRTTTGNQRGVFRGIFVLEIVQTLF